VKQEMLKERVELLAIGEAIGYPRLGIGHRDGKKLAAARRPSAWRRLIMAASEVGRRRRQRCG